MPPIRGPLSAEMPLDLVVLRLAARAEIESVVLVGSGGRDELTVASDYDVVVVLVRRPVPISLILTTVDHRVAEIVFTTADEIERITASIATIADASADGGLAHRFADGKILFDRAGRSTQAQARIRASMPLILTTEAERYAVWFNINYDLRMLKHLLSADDPVHLLAVDYRLLSQLADLWRAYFTVRRFPWRGEKEAIRFLNLHDPHYLAAFQECLAEADLQRKVGRYEALVGMTLAPVGQLWPEDATAADGAPDEIESILDFWEYLVAEAP